MQNTSTPSAAVAATLERRRPGAALAQAEATAIQLEPDLHLLLELNTDAGSRAAVESIVEALASQ